MIKLISKAAMLGLMLGLTINTLVRAQDGRPKNAGKPVRRALLVGINKYKISRTNKEFPELTSSLNDVRVVRELLSVPTYGFQIKVLQNEEATRKRILQEFKEFLINKARPGDVSLFYFSGHGSQVKNTLNGESDKKDETIVPYDVVRPVEKRSDLMDIRDDELNAFLNQAVEKGVRIIEIVDSCHSGTIGRGDGDVRQIDRARFDIRERPTGPRATKRGALVISAAQDFQLASSSDYSRVGLSGGTIGNLTANLVLSLYRTPAHLISAGNLFKRISAGMRADGLSQQPMIQATKARRRLTIFGEKLNSRAARAVVAVQGGNFYLAAGLVDGLSDGSEMVRIREANDRETKPPIRIRLTKVDLTKSAFEIVQPPGRDEPAEPRSGDFFKQVTWGVSNEPYLTVWTPPSNLTRKRIKGIARELDKLRKENDIELVTDLSLDAETHVLSLETRRRKSKWVLNLAGGGNETLSGTPKAGSLKRLLRNKSGNKKIKLFINLPPPRDLTEQMALTGTDAGMPVRASKTRKGAIYELIGRARVAGGKVILEYAWVLPTASNENEAGESGISSPRSLPLSTDWVDSENREWVTKLNELASRLAKIRAWLILTPPPGSDRRYPYRFEMRTMEGERLDDAYPLMENERYRVFLKAEPVDLKENFDISSRFYIYLINIDGNGNSALLYGEESDEPAWFDSLSPPAEIDLTGDYPIRICDSKESKCVLGTEIYILLMTDTPINDPDHLQFEGVKTNTPMTNEGTNRTGSSDLERLLMGIGTGSSSRDGLSVPDKWFVQKVRFVSRKKN